MMQDAVKKNLNELAGLLQQLSQSQYNAKIPELSGATIGEHTRHIIEMFQCLFNESDSTINYDSRQRDLLLQTDIETAIAALNEMGRKVPATNQPLTLIQYINGEEYRIASNTFRELLYNLEHAIHHEALIKVALTKWDNISVSADFGVARSTIEYRNQCAQ